MLETARNFKTVRQLQRKVRVFQKGAQNAMELLKEGRLSAPYQTPFAILHDTQVYKLRRYVHEGDTPRKDNAPVILLVPPLMVASEVYDISPELSAVAWMVAQGLDVWLTDFGAPEHQEGGMDRTLDDHILAISDAIDRIRSATGKDVHLIGYSQGGMFAYQCAAYRKSEGILSLVTFGSPVNLHRNLPNIKESVAQQVIQRGSKVLTKPLEYMDGLTGAMSSTGFKLMSGTKELQQIMGFFKVLHDREALEKRERQRRFLGGEGFVAWPGPALRKFVDEMVVNNRMISGGVVINGRSVTLADIYCPVLYFVGSRDEFGRPASVRAIRNAALNASLYEIELKAGHFGLVVGSKALKITWPTVYEWTHWIEGKGKEPNFNPENIEHEHTEDHTPREGFMGNLYDAATEMFDGVWNRLGNVSLETSEMIDVLRWQLPRIAQIWKLQESGLNISLSSALTEQSQAIPEATFFLWEGNAFTYKQAEYRVNQILSGLINAGVKPGMYVGIYMNNHPDFLTTLAALNRMNAVAVLLNAESRGFSFKQALMTGQVRILIADKEHMEGLSDNLGLEKIWILGADEETKLPEGLISFDPYIEKDLDTFESPFPLNAGRSEDLAMLIFTSGTTGMPKAVKVTNRRWCMASLATAAAATLTTRDTVYCCLPLYHSSGLMIVVGGALIGGSRLALAPRFSVSSFWGDVRRYGVSVVGYVGEMCRYLINAPETPNEKNHSIRLFMGNGMQKHIWEDVMARFHPEKILEFYASTEGNVALVNLSGEKIGSVGRPMYDPGRIQLIRFNPETQQLIISSKGRAMPCETNETGLLVARIDDKHPAGKFDGYMDPSATASKILRDLFKDGDAWFSTGDLMRMDEDGDYWFVDRIGDTFRWKGENVSTEMVGEIISQLPFVAAATSYGVLLPGREGRVGVVCLEIKADEIFDGKALFKHVEQNLTKAARPRVVRLVSRMETTGTLKFVKSRLRDEGIDPYRISDPLYLYDVETQSYVPMTPADYPAKID
ncbi:MAG: long-chain-acyl-CoA synthetase [SAR324 cluster bacterium]|nr:long-chain-acyl-CoA synthetase [SAR324 cluster bacterium]